jgi:hypothetical protein
MNPDRKADIAGFNVTTERASFALAHTSTNPDMSAGQSDSLSGFYTGPSLPRARRNRTDNPFLKGCPVVRFGRGRGAA